ncbi:MAG: VOC family protein [Phycisphaerales bacterium]|nr:VOC family protein [Phycisphaerae bacterium]NNF42157.1 VOC family protein [Phycisphaerales bacterium]NNM27727.1 VOC family protein [Phycisphaerales bacterium]
MPHPVVHFEIGCQDLAKTKAFYSSLFGWSMDDMGPQAAMIATGTDEGIDGHFSTLGHEPHQYVTFYVQVDDVQGALDKATGLGAKEVVPPTEVPGMGHFAWMSDPEGNCIGLWQPSKG